jgi:hypothetical protein
LKQRCSLQPRSRRWPVHPEQPATINSKESRAPPPQNDRETSDGVVLFIDVRAVLHLLAMHSMHLHARVQQVRRKEELEHPAHGWRFRRMLVFQTFVLLLLRASLRRLLLHQVLLMLLGQWEREAKETR